MDEANVHGCPVTSSPVPSFDSIHAWKPKSTLRSDVSGQRPKATVVAQHRKWKAATLDDR